MQLEKVLRRALKAVEGLRNEGSPGSSTWRALASIIATVASHGSDPELCCSIGHALSERGFDEQSLKCYMRAVVLQPSDPLVWYGKGAILFRLGCLLWLSQYHASQLSTGCEFTLGPKRR